MNNSECKAPCLLCCISPENKKCTLSWNSLMEDMELSIREERICKENGIVTVKDLHEKIDTLKFAKGCGIITIESLEKTLEELMLAIYFEEEARINKENKP